MKTIKVSPIELGKYKQVCAQENRTSPPSIVQVRWTGKI